MDFLPGQSVYATVNADVYDARGRVIHSVPDESVVQIAGGKKFIISEDPSRRGQWFWAYPVTDPTHPGTFAWVRETDLHPYDEMQYHAGALSDITLPGVVFPPYGLYQALSGGRPLLGPSSPPGAAPAPLSESPWPTVAKFAIVAGGALAVYLIYVASKHALPIQEKAGAAVGKYLGARVGSTTAGPSSRSYVRYPLLPAAPRSQQASIAAPLSGQDHPLLGAYDYYST